MAELLHGVKSETNSVHAWFDDCSIGAVCEQERLKEAVYEHYRTWCDRNGLSAMASPRFWTRLRDVAHFEESRRRMGGAQTRVCNIPLPA